MISLQSVQTLCPLDNREKIELTSLQNRRGRCDSSLVRFGCPFPPAAMVVMVPMMVTVVMVTVLAVAQVLPLNSSFSEPFFSQPRSG